MKNQIYNFNEKHMVDNQSSNIIKKLQSDLENTEKYINELILDLNNLSETLPESLEVKSLLEKTKKEIISISENLNSEEE
mgnify:FL=1